MGSAGVGWIMAIIVGGLAGWIASRLMRTRSGVLLNVVLGIVGAAVASFLFGIIGIGFSGVIGYLISGILGAAILIALVRAVQR